jgi:hypothetical protein
MQCGDEVVFGGLSRQIVEITPSRYTTIAKGIA